MTPIEEKIAANFLETNLRLEEILFQLRMCVKTLVEITEKLNTK